jgi:hypothetical protein
MSDDDDDTFGGLPLPPGLVRHVLEQHDREHMRADETRMKLYGLLDGLDKDQLMTLRHILNMSPVGINYVDGQVAAQLRLIHKADPDTGDDLPPGL